MVDGEPARIKLREVVLNTLKLAGSMEARALRDHNLELVGLRSESAEDTNIHAWALSDLVRTKKIRRVERESKKLNRLRRPIIEAHYELVSA